MLLKGWPRHVCEEVASRPLLKRLLDPYGLLWVGVQLNYLPCFPLSRGYRWKKACFLEIINTACCHNNSELSTLLVSGLFPDEPFSLTGGLLLIERLSYSHLSSCMQNRFCFITAEPASLQKGIWFRLEWDFAWDCMYVPVCVLIHSTIWKAVCLSRVYLKAEPSLVTMPTHFNKRHRIYLNEFIFKLMFASVVSVSCVHTLNSCRVEAFSIAKSDRREIAYWFFGGNMIKLRSKWTLHLNLSTEEKIRK